MGIDRVVLVIKQWRYLAIAAANAFLCGAEVYTMQLDSTLHDDSTSDFNHLFLLCKVERVCNETRQDLSLTNQECFIVDLHRRTFIVAYQDYITSRQYLIQWVFSFFTILYSTWVDTWPPSFVRLSVAFVRSFVCYVSISFVCYFRISRAVSSIDGYIVCGNR